MSSFKYIPPQE